MISALISGSIRGYVFENPVEVHPLISTDHEFYMRNKRVVAGIGAGGLWGGEMLIRGHRNEVITERPRLEEFAP